MKWFCLALLCVLSTPIIQSCRQAGQYLTLSDAISDEDKELAKQAANLFTQKCADCHDATTNAGGFQTAGNLSSLRIDRRLVEPFKPNESPVYYRAADGDMPPGEPLQEPEITLIKKWIEAGAPGISEAQRPFLELSKIYELILQDFAKIPRGQIRTIRYLSLAHLWNAADREGNHLYDINSIQSFYGGINKILNSLSWSPKLSKAKVVPGSFGTLLRIDLADYQSERFVGRTKTLLGLQASQWEQLGKENKLGIFLKSKVAAEVRKVMGTQYPVIDADYFAFAATQAPHYNTILGIPQPLQKGGEQFVEDQLLGINANANIRNFRTSGMLRAGFIVSGVSKNASRLIERHDLVDGYYWKSYDFATNVGRKNLFENVVGPKALDDFFRSTTFEHDGGEVIWSLPNGMQGYGLYAANGTVLAKAPVEIVNEPVRGEVINGVSCMYCHTKGLIKKKDDMREHVLTSYSHYPASDLEFLKTILVENDDLNDVYETDMKRHMDALQEIGVDPSAPDVASALAEQYRTGSLSAADVAARLFITIELFDALNLRSRNAGAFLTLRNDAARIRRDSFEDAFPKFVAEHALDDPEITSRYERPADLTTLSDKDRSYVRSIHICDAKLADEEGYEKNVCGFSRVSKEDAQRNALATCQQVITGDLAGFGFACGVSEADCEVVEDSDNPCLDRQNKNKQ